MAGKDEPSNTDLVYEVLASAEQPLTFQEIFDAVNRRRPITTRNPKGTVRNALSQGRQLLSLGDGRYGYLPNLLQGSLFRLPFTEKKSANHPLVYPDEVRQALWPSFFESQKRSTREPVHIRFHEGEGFDLPLEFLGKGVWGSHMPDALRLFLVENRSGPGDSLLIRVLDANARRYEVWFEVRRQRDEGAVGRRNRELADIVADLLIPRGQRWGRFIWELVFDLLARGFYRSDVAPDSLETILNADSRFVDGGMGMWTLAASMTPETEAAVRYQKKMETELFQAVGSSLELPSETPSALSTRYAMERTLAEVGSALSEKEFGSTDEANAFLQELMAKGGLARRQSATPLETAQELMYDAWESPSARERVKLARQALKVSPDCADAYVLLAEETARSAEEAADLYSKGVAAGERALGKEAFAQDVGQFWGILETRPYMRARLGLALALWEIGRRREAIDHLWEMLRLNPGDNQGVRYLLLSWLLETGDDAQVKRLLNRYPDEVTGQWAYGRALHAFRTAGDTRSSRMLRAEAKKRNPYAQAYLMGRKKTPRGSPQMIGIGDESEAIAISEEQGAAWRKTPGAADWLGESDRHA
jgi:tetratricopeptide (TPR) repeat protein